MQSSKHEEIIFPLELIFMFILYFFAAMKKVAAIKKCYENWRIWKKYKIGGGGGGGGWSGRHIGKGLKSSANCRIYSIRNYIKNALEKIFHSV